MAAPAPHLEARAVACNLIQLLPNGKPRHMRACRVLGPLASSQSPLITPSEPSEARGHYSWVPRAACPRQTARSTSRYCKASSLPRAQPGQPAPTQSPTDKSIGSGHATSWSAASAPGSSSSMSLHTILQAPFQNRSLLTLGSAARAPGCRASPRRLCAPAPPCLFHPLRPCRL